MRNYLLILILCLIPLMASQCSDKSLVTSNVDTKVPFTLTHFANISSSGPTRVSVLDLTDAGIDQVEVANNLKSFVNVDTVTVNIPLNFKLNAPIKLTIPVTNNIKIEFPSIIVIVAAIILIFILFPYIMIVFYWMRKK